METNAPDHLSRRCAKCLMAMPNPDWIVNKDMAYCSECATLLHLGESKESRIFNEMQDNPPNRAPEALDPTEAPGEE